MNSIGDNAQETGARLDIGVDEQGIMTARISNPGRLNAWTTGVRTQLALALREAAYSDQVRAVVLVGEGGNFCAGQDLNEQVDWDPSVDQMDNFEALYRAVRDCPKPTVAGIEGAAVGSALQLALLCDLRVGSVTARMGQTEVRWGMPSVTGTYLLSQAVGPIRARTLALTTAIIQGEQLLQLGLIDEVTAEGEAGTVAHARAVELAQLPAPAYAMTKQYSVTADEEGFRIAFAEARTLHRIATEAGDEKAGAERFLAGNQDAKETSA